jgi:hypothetical protein
VLLLAIALASAGAGGAPLAVPVSVGGEREHDACAGVGVVTGLDPRGANALAVRSGPGTRYGKVDRLGPLAEVVVCEQRESWLGVVYGEDGQDCGLGGPVANRAAYGGPCKSGWVSSAYVRLLAG